MRSKKLRIPDTRYCAMTVWNGEHHHVRIRFLDKRQIPRDRGTVHTIVSRAANYRGTRRLTIDRASRGKWHAVDIRHRALARRFMVEIELLAVLGIVEIELDGHVVGIAKEQ